MIKYRLALLAAVLASCLFLGSLLAPAHQPTATATANTIANVPHASGMLPQFGTDIQVNGEFDGKEGVASNASMAVSPIDPNFIVSGYDSEDADQKISGYARSIDGGRTWASGEFTETWGSGLTPMGEATVGFDGSGIAYYMGLAAGVSGRGYFVLTSTNGLDWSAPVQATSDTKEIRSFGYLAVDPRASGPYAGSLYIFYLYNNNVAPNYYGIRMRYSRDHGATWSGDIQVSDAGNEHSSYPHPVVASDGSIYVAYQQLDNGDINQQPKFYMDRSTDGGATWGQDRLISGAPIQRIGGPDFKGHEIVLVGSAGCTPLRIDSVPVIAVAPTQPQTVYVAWNDGRWDSNIQECEVTGKHGDIAFTSTSNAGQTWSPVIRVNDDEQANGVDQFQPSIAVQPDGTVALAWYDRRYEATHYFYDVAYSQSTDSGLTWSPNIRVTDASSNPENVVDVKGVTEIGSRKPLVAGGDYVLPGWVDASEEKGIGNFNVDYGDLNAVPPSPTATSTSVPTACNLNFADVPANSTFYSYVRCLACRNILGGYPCGAVGEPCNSSNDPYFRPGANMSRGQLAKIAANAAGLHDVLPATRQTYSDVAPGSPFRQYIEELSARNVMGGYPCGAADEPCDSESRPYFRPAHNVTRGQTAKIVANTANLTANIPPDRQTYSDVAPDSPFRQYIERLSAIEVMGGYPCGGMGEACDIENRPYFRSSLPVTRGQASKIVGNTFFPACNTPAAR